MTSNTLKDKLHTKILGKDIIYFDQIDSTNTQAKRLMEEQGLKEGCIILAGQQSKGKGTDGNTWASAKGNLYLSVIFNYDDKINTLFPIYPAVALAKVLNNKFNIKAHVKWPNDVLVGNKKIAGILCEGVAGKFMIMGIGININQESFPKDIDNIAISMKEISQDEHSITEVFTCFIEEYEELLFGDSDIRQEWLSLTKMIGKTINTTLNGDKAQVKVTGLSKEGFLEVEDTEGHKHTWMARRGLDISANY